MNGLKREKGVDGKLTRRKNRDARRSRPYNIDRMIYQWKVDFQIMLRVSVVKCLCVPSNLHISNASCVGENI